MSVLTMKAWSAFVLVTMGIGVTWAREADGRAWAAGGSIPGSR